MSIQPPLPTAEAKVLIRNFGSSDWRDCLEIDPVSIPVESRDLMTTDVFNSTVIALVDAVIEAEMDETGFGPKDPSYDYTIVWSATGREVKGVCPRCDEIFPIAEGVPGDELNEGYDAVWCGGCDPEDGDDFSDGNDEEIDFAG